MTNKSNKFINYSCLLILLFSAAANIYAMDGGDLREGSDLRAKLRRIEALHDREREQAVTIASLLTDHIATIAQATTSAAREEAIRKALAFADARLLAVGRSAVRGDGLEVRIASMDAFLLAQGQHIVSGCVSGHK